jgi:hypothetical protein
MPVASFVMGAEGWTPIGLKGNRDDTRMIPIGPIHAAEPQDGTSVCGGLALEVDREGRSFTPWGPGTCERCSESLEPRPPDTPTDSARVEAAERAVADSDTVEEAAARAAEEADAERPIGAARPEREGPDGEPLGGEGS